MNICGIPVDIRYKPTLDVGFILFGAFKRAFETSATTNGGSRFSIAIERGHGQTSLHETVIHGKPEYLAADRLYVERLVKFLLWMKGGHRILLNGKQDICSL